MQLKFSATTPSSSSWLPGNIAQSRDPAEEEQQQNRFNYQGNWWNCFFQIRWNTGKSYLVIYISNMCQYACLYI